MQSMLLFKMEEREAHKEFVQVLLLKRATVPANFDAAIKLAISYGGVASNAISSIIKQLEIEQSGKSYQTQKLILGTLSVPKHSEWARRVAEACV